MSKNSKHVDTTETLGIENRSLDSVIFHPTKPVLDSELNLGADLNSGRLQDVIRSKVPSGWLDSNYDIGFDENYETYGINTTLEADTFYINSQKNTPSLAVVNGWLLQIGGTNIEDEDHINKIVLNPAVNNREDLVFLEVWKAAVKSNTTEGKPDLDKIWKFGNTEYGGTNPDDEIVNSSVGFETTTRVQIQYRIRVVDNVDFEGYPEGVGDINNVFPMGGRETIAPDFNFVNASDLLDDAGLYVAGDGSDAAKNTLKTVDGYVYAIPMMRVQRRNKTAFSIINQNGSEYSVDDGVTSDRPDGFYYDQIADLDIEDLRHAVSFDKFNYKSLLEETFDSILSGELKTTLKRSELDNSLKRTNLGFYVNKIANFTGVGTNLLTQPNGQQRYYSDVAKSVKVTQKFTIDDKSVGSSGGNWTASDVVTLEIKNPSPAGTVIGAMTPIVRFKYNNGGVDSIRTVTGTFSGGGTGTESFTLGNNSSVDLTNQDIYITYEIDYPQKGNKLTKPVTDILRVHDLDNNVNWGILSVHDLDIINSPTYPYRRETKVPVRETLGNSDYAYTYSIQHSRNYYGVGTLVSYFVEGNGSQNYTIPGTLINPQDTEYIVAAYDVDNTSPAFMDLVSVVRNPINNSLDVTLPYTITAGRAIRFDVVVSGGILEFDEKTQTIEDMGKVDWFEISGNDTDTVVIKDCLFGKDPEDIILGSQTEFYSGGYQTTCYVDNYRQFVNVFIDPYTSMISLTFPLGVISSSSIIRISLLSKKTLNSTDNINIYYNYKEYKGITARTNFGEFANSYINSKVVYHDNRLRIMTSGTGGRNTADLLPKKYENSISLLPLKDGVDGNFTGTDYTSKTILGGSYTINSEYSSPYSAGKMNTMTNEGVAQKRGTFKGGRFTSVAEEGVDNIHKLVVAPLVEMITEDGTDNFKPGEIALKVETNYLDNTTVNRITNYDSSEVNNSFDMFKIKGRPLIKVSSK